MYEVKTAAEVLRILGTDKDKGLKRREAMERKTKYGANKLKDQEQKSLGQMILEQLNDPLILILVVAMAISLMLHELGDAIIIITVVALNATVGIIQEGKAGKAVEALKNGDADIERMREEYDARRRYLLHRFREMGISCFEPYGAFYMFPCIKKFGMTSEEFAEKLLECEKVAVVPGTAFGAGGEGFVRVSYASSLSDLKKAAEHIERFIANLAQ